MKRQQRKNLKMETGKRREEVVHNTEVKIEKKEEVLENIEIEDQDQLKTNMNMRNVKQDKEVEFKDIRTNMETIDTKEMKDRIDGEDTIEIERTVVNSKEIIEITKIETTTKSMKEIMIIQNNMENKTNTKMIIIRVRIQLQRKLPTR